MKLSKLFFGSGTENHIRLWVGLADILFLLNLNFKFEIPIGFRLLISLVICIRFKVGEMTFRLGSLDRGPFVWNILEIFSVHDIVPIGTD